MHGECRQDEQRLTMSDLTPEGVLVCGAQLRKGEGPLHPVSSATSYCTRFEKTAH